MPLVKSLLEQQIYTAFKKMQSATKDTETAQRELAKDLAIAIDSYIKSATIIIPPGQSVSGTNAPGQLTIFPAVPTPVPLPTTTPGVVTAVTVTPSPAGLIT